MAEEYRTADKVIKEKYEDRGWNQELGVDTRTALAEEIKPLPLSKEEYIKFCMLFSKLAISDRNPKLCEIYFDLQRRAIYANGYLPVETMQDIEQEMWSIGTGAIIEDFKNSPHI